MDSKQVIARFQLERQALALMDHPNIAKVFDAGTTDTGRPFIVMELVQGTKITEYCDKLNLSARERLQLFEQICGAIQHAHQKGIVHRDIKPSNILVRLQDGEPTAKVIDFGIAKATAGQPLTDQTVFTAFEQFLGTPAYMSPEQAEMRPKNTDSRSDVYSLGVLLYELLTSKTPFDSSLLLEGGLDAMRRTIQEQAPERPSAKLRTMLVGELANTANHRQTEPSRLIKLVQGDLDQIVMKCLEKDRTQRYETVGELEADIRRFLRNEPIQARPPSVLYRFGKLAQRHKLAFAAAAIVAVALIVAGGILTYALKVTRREQPSAPSINIAVLPFTNKSPDRISNYVTVSLTYEVINGLQNVTGISAFGAPSNQSSDQIRDLLNPLGARLVEGSVEEKNGKLNVEFRLLEAFTGGILVSTNYQRNFTDLLGVPNDITLQIASQLINRLPVPSRDRITRLPTRDPAAYDYYLRGRAAVVEGFFSRRDLGTDAIPDLQSAIKRDAAFPLALATLSRCYVIQYFYLNPEREADLEPEARKAFEEALRLDPELAEAHFAKGSYFWTPSQHWNVTNTISEYLKALSLSPNSEEISDQLALVYLHVGLFDKVHTVTAQGGKNSPLSPLPQYFEGNAFFWEGNNKKAVSIWERYSAGLKRNFVINSYFAVALINLNKTNEALGIINPVLKGNTVDIGGLMASADAILRAKLSDGPAAKKDIEAALSRRGSFGHFHHALYNIASAYSLLNDTTNAMKYLRQAADDGFPCYPLFKGDENLRNLHGNLDYETFMNDQEKKYEQHKRKFGTN